MSSFNTPVYHTGLRAGADLSAKTYKALVFSSGKLVVAGANVRAFGFLMNAPLADDHCEVAVLGGGAKAIAGGNITAGQPLKTDANGDLVLADTDKDKVVAVACEDAVDNDVFAIRPVMFDISMA